MLSESVALEELRRVLTYWLEGGRLANQIKVAFKGKRAGADLVVQIGNHILLAIEYKGTSDAAAVATAIAHARKSADELRERVNLPVIPVVAVPFMGDVGQRLCAEAGVSWVDLSGNADIVAPMLRIRGEGRPNKYARRGRPSTALGPRSSRIARLLLMEPSRFFRQQELARESGLDDGFVSRIVRRLDADRLIARAEDGAVRVRDPSLLLDAWLEVYDFTKHRIIHGHVTTRSSEDLMAQLAKSFAGARLRHAATGLAAAWLHTRFAGFRLVTFFTERKPTEALLREIGFREEPKGANVWLVVPNDEGVFVGAARKDGVMCVHPVQACLDLPAHPERAKEAAEEMRARFLAGAK